MRSVLKSFRRFMTMSTVLLAGCTAVGPEYMAPQTDVPDAWQRQIESDLESGDAGLHSWWKTFNDPVLDSLIERGGSGNLTLRQAFARIKQARASLGIARGERFPNLDASGAVQHGRLSEGSSTLVPPPRGGRIDTSRSVGIDTSWEIDFWGRIARSIEAASGTFEASIEDYHAILVLLNSQIAGAYVDLRTFQERLRVAQENVVLQRESLRLARSRARAELAPLLDVRQAEQNLARTESAIPQFEEGIVRGINRLSVLIGSAPGTLYDELVEAQPIPAPTEVARVVQPVELVRQRPDIRGAERRLAAQTARIGIATADLYPRFSLSGIFAFETVSGDLLSGDNVAFSFGPAFRWRLFDGGRIKSFIDVQDARTEEALKRYEETVLVALEEVENAIVGFSKESTREQALARSEKAAAQSVRLVRKLYTSGLTNFQNVLDSERSLFAQQDARIASQGRRTGQLIELYRALGGGWQPAPEETEEQRDNRDREVLPFLGIDLIEVDMSSDR